MLQPVGHRGSSPALMTFGPSLSLSSGVDRKRGRKGRRRVSPGAMQRRSGVRSPMFKFTCTSINRGTLLCCLGRFGSTFPSATVGEKEHQLPHLPQVAGIMGESIFPLPSPPQGRQGAVWPDSPLSHRRAILPLLCQQGHLGCAAQVRNRALFPAQQLVKGRTSSLVCHRW